MNGWLILISCAISAMAGLTFLSIVADDLLRADTDLKNRKWLHCQAEKERQIEAQARQLALGRKAPDPYGDSIEAFYAADAAENEKPPNSDQYPGGNGQDHPDKDPDSDIPTY